MKSRYVVAFYHADLAYGGPEEGGWYYDVGSLIRVSRVFTDEEKAFAYCRRANDLLYHLQKDNPRADISSVLSEGRIAAEVHEQTAPLGYPDRKPHYE